MIIREGSRAVRPNKSKIFVVETFYRQIFLSVRPKKRTQKRKTVKLIKDAFYWKIFSIKLFLLVSELL